MYIILARPIRSASPPATTMKMPENNDVIDTARFASVCSTPSWSLMPGITLSSVWAKSQKLMTARTMPSSHLSVGFQSVRTGTDVDEVMGPIPYCAKYYCAKYASAATTCAWVATESVGSMAGAKNGEWL